MDFMCVFTVDGSLVSYEVEQRGEGCFEANLKGAPDRPLLPGSVTLEKGAEGWQASPPHPVIGRALIHALP